MTEKERLLLDVPTQLVGERIVVRAYRPGDGAAMFEAVDESRDHLLPGMAWVHGMVDGDDCEAYARKREAEYLLRNDLSMGIWDPATARFLGGTGLHRIDWSVRSFEIGYWIRKTAEGRGYVTETVRLLTDMAFGALAANRVFIRVTEDNVRSRRIPERLGFTLEGTVANEICDADGQLHAIRYYGMTPEQWAALK